MGASLEDIVDGLIARYHGGEALDSIQLPGEVTDFRGKMALVARILLSGGHDKMGALADHLSCLPTPEDGKRGAADPGALVHIIVDDGFPGAVTGELCPHSGVYTTRAGLQEILKKQD